MRVRVILLLVCVLLPLFSQTLDTVIKFPYEIGQLFHIPERNKLYVSAYVRDSRTYQIYIVNCSTMAISGVIQPVPPARGRPHCGAWCYKHNKVYWGEYEFSTPDIPGLAVIDNATDSVLYRLPVGVVSSETDGVPTIAYSSSSDKVVAVDVESTITIIDCATDSIIKKIICTTPNIPGQRVLWDSVGDKMYIGSIGWIGGDRIIVVDCRADSVAKIISTRLYWPIVACYNPLRRKVYFGASVFWGLVVIDCVRDSVVKRFDSIFSLAEMEPVYCAQEDKIYFPTMAKNQERDTIYVIDGKSDSVINGIPVPPVGSGYLWGIDYAPWTNRLYVGSRRWGNNLLTVIDCATDSIIGQVRFGNTGNDIVCNSVDHKIYVSSWNDSAVYVFREDLQPVEEMKDIEPGGFTLEPTIVRNVLSLPSAASGERLTVSAYLLDIAGRKVLELKSGANDIRHLAPGVYFIQTGSSIERRVVITR